MSVVGSGDVQLQRHLRHCPVRARPVAFTSTQPSCRQSPSRHRSTQRRELRQAPGLLITRQTFENRCCFQTSTAAFQPQEVPVEQIQQPQPSSNAPKFRPFVPQTGVRQELLDYRYKVKVGGGTLHIRPLTQSWVHECGSLLTNAFADAMGYLPVYRTYLRHQIRQYLQRHAEMPPKAIVLIALLVPDTEDNSQEQQQVSYSRDSGSQAQVSTSKQEEENNSSQEGDGGQQEASTGQEDECKGILVGTVELSFVASTRARYLTLNAPSNCAYLANMAVDGNYRRRGYGNILLHAADAVTKIAGEKTIYLHLRFQDAAPAQLYKQAGYVPDKEDIFLVKLLGLDRRYLMKKTFVS